VRDARLEIAGTSECRHIHFREFLGVSIGL
jgi:hypothetical protein